MTGERCSGGRHVPAQGPPIPDRRGGAEPAPLAPVGREPRARHGDLQLRCLPLRRLRGHPVPGARRGSVRVPRWARRALRLNATTTGGWVRYAQLLANAGADAIELNLYRLAADPNESAADVEALRPVLDPAVSLAATSGVHSGGDVVKALMVGADVAMTASALLRHGPEHLATIEAEVRAWMTEHEHESVSQLRGSVTTATSDDPAAFERANYLRTLHSWTTPPSLVPGPPPA